MSPRMAVIATERMIESFTCPALRMIVRFS